jgi:hypothetical protein
MKRPPVTWSIVVAAFARSAGWRNVLASTECPIHIPGTRCASAAASVRDSKLGPPDSAAGSEKWSFIHPATKTGSSAAAAHVSSRVANETCWGDVLKPNVTRPATALTTRRSAGWPASGGRS